LVKYNHQVQEPATGSEV